MKRNENVTVKTGVSRRDFIKGAAAGALGVATMGILGACASDDANTTTTGAESTTATITTAAATETSTAAAETVPVATSAVDKEINTSNDGALPWLGAEPQIADSDVEEEISSDVIVIGAGLAGVCATRSAVEEGASVTVIEKADGPQCRSGEFAVVNGDLQAGWGRDNMDPDAIANRFMRECTYRIKRPIISRWANDCADVFQWYIDAKEDLYICETTRSEVPDENVEAYLVPLAHPLPEHYNYKEEEFPVFPTSVEFRPNQAPVLAANMEKAMSDGEVSPFYGYFAEKLIKEDGRITGVYARNSETGKYLKATATKGVILASGDYGSNSDLLDYYCPEVNENGVNSMWMNMDVEGNPTNTGDGLKLGAWAGVKIQQSHAPMIHHMGGAMGITPFLLLNINGDRFTNEDVPGQQLENQIELTPQHTAYQIFDAGWPEQVEYMPAGHGVVCYYDESKPKNNETDRAYKCRQDVEDAVEAGRLITADTIEELLDQLDIDKESALASIQRYNEMANNGRDEDFGKAASRMFALENPPYYASTFGLTVMLVCIGGLESDEECHTYDEDRNIIPGLYVAGNIQGNRCAVEYPICVKGISHSMAMFYGYTAGKNCVNEI